MWHSFLQQPRGSYYRRSMAIQETELMPRPWDTYDSFLQFTLWPGPIDMDMPPGKTWGTAEDAFAIDLLRQRNEDQPPRDDRN
jgi:hypothetical protein